MTIQDEKAEIARLDQEIEQEQQRHAAALQTILSVDLNSTTKGGARSTTDTWEGRRGGASPASSRRPEL
jgi:hypothetical protein